MLNNKSATELGRKPAQHNEQVPALRAYLGGGHARIPGWLEPLALRSTLIIDCVQKEQNIHGSMCEIGVHRARLLILMHLLSRADERTVGFDLFELMGSDVETVYGQYNRPRLIESLMQNGCDLERIDLIAADSTTLEAELVLQRTEQRVRMFSVDGGHDAATALSDMRLAERVVCPGGVVLLDDIFNEQWCGVAEAAARYLLSEHELVPFLHAGNKMFFASGRSYADAYRARATKEMNDVTTKVETFFDYPVLLAWEPTKSPMATAVSIVLGENALKALRRSSFVAALKRRSS